MAALMDRFGSVGEMSGPNPINPRHLTSDERRAEVCRLLALGLIRLRGRQSSQVFADAGETSLHFPPDRSGHANPKRRRIA